MMPARMVFTKRNRLALDYDRFGGGIFNPSLAAHAGFVWGLARCEPHDQAARNADKALNFLPMQSVMFRLDDALHVAEAHYDVHFENFPDLPWRTEDYRLFEFQGQLFCTHILWVRGYNIGMALSRVDFAARTITLIRPITIDGLQIQGIEKNWVMIPTANVLHCLYSFYPEYTVAELVDLESARFRLSSLIKLQPPANGLADKLISLSTVPQRIGDALFLLVHQKDDEMIYRDYLARLHAEAHTLEAISADPVIAGGDCEGFWRGYLTVYSLLLQNDHALLSYGEGDRFCGVAVAPLENLLAVPMNAITQ